MRGAPPDRETLLVGPARLFDIHVQIRDIAHDPCSLVLQPAGVGIRNEDVTFLENRRAGVDPRPGITGDLLVRAILDAHPNSSITYLPGRDQVADYLSSILRPGDLCLTMGAGDLTSVPDEVQVLRKVEEP